MKQKGKKIIPMYFNNGSNETFIEQEYMYNVMCMPPFHYIRDSIVHL